MIYFDRPHEIFLSRTLGRSPGCGYNGPMNNTTRTTAEKITNRLTPCNCGCNGRDSQHARTFVRVVSDVVALDTPALAVTRAFGRATVIARGFVSLPGRDEPVAVGFVVHHVDGFGWHRSGWTVLA